MTNSERGERKEITPTVQKKTPHLTKVTKVKESDKQ
jgi:hypothetical protein